MSDGVLGDKNSPNASSSGRRWLLLHNHARQTFTILAYGLKGWDIDYNLK